MPTLSPIPSPTLAAGLSTDSLLSHVVSHDVIGFIDNHMLMGVVASVLVFLGFASLARQIAKPKRGVEDYVVKGVLPQLLETMCVFVREEVAKPNLGRLTDKYIPYLWTTFFFILFCNVLGLIPINPVLGIVASIVGADAGYWSHIGGTATGTIAMTIPLALVAFAMINLVGIKEQGIGYFKHFCPIEVTSPAMMPLAVLLIVLEVMSLIIKSCVLAARLFGTMMAGHLVLAAFIGLTALTTSAIFGGVIGVAGVFIGGALMGLELFIALLQAFIFTFLTTLFIAAGAVHHGHDDHHDHVETDTAAPAAI
ncbi:MAG: F0F1 ATP synthase subunit A [Planctomycetota bacterium]